MPKKKENLGDIIDRNKAKLEADPNHKSAVYPKRIPDEEIPVAPPKKSNPSKKVSPWKDVVNPEVKSESPKELMAQWKVGKPEEVEAKRTGLFASGKVAGEVELSGVKKLREAGQGANELEAKMKLQAEGPKININESKKAADLHTTLNTGEVKLSFTKPAAPPPAAPQTTKTVVAEPVATKVEPAAITKAAKEPALAGVEKLAKSKTSPLEKKTTSIFKKLKPGKDDPLAKFAVSVEGENLKQASRAGTTPDVESPRAKLRMEMDEAGKAMKRFDPVKKYTPPVKISRPPLELPYSDAEVGKKTSSIFEELKTSVANRPKATAEATPEWLGVARKAAAVAEEGSTISKAAKVGEIASKTAGKLGKLGIAGLAIYGGIEALKKIGEKLKE